MFETNHLKGRLTHAMYVDSILCSCPRQARQQDKNQHLLTSWVCSVCVLPHWLGWFRLPPAPESFSPSEFTDEFGPHNYEIAILSGQGETFPHANPTVWVERMPKFLQKQPDVDIPAKILHMYGRSVAVENSPTRFWPYCGDCWHGIPSHLRSA